jgi:hypothetical protein
VEELLAAVVGILNAIPTEALISTFSNILYLTQLDQQA